MQTHRKRFTSPCPARTLSELDPQGLVGPLEAEVRPLDLTLGFAVLPEDQPLDVVRPRNAILRLAIYPPPPVSSRREGRAYANRPRSTRDAGKALDSTCSSAPQARSGLRQAFGHFRAAEDSPLCTFATASSWHTDKVRRGRTLHQQVVQVERRLKVLFGGRRETPPPLILQPAPSST